MSGHVFVCCAIDFVCFYDLILELFDSVVLLFFHFIFPSYILRLEIAVLFLSNFMSPNFTKRKLIQ
jgi:hypothetical protein